jgi:hypothetical protein
MACPAIDFRGFQFFVAVFFIYFITENYFQKKSAQPELNAL